MADTLPCVVWALRFECPYRQGDAVTDIGAAITATAKLRQIDSCEQRGDIFGDIGVTSTVYFKDNKSPGGGFRISQAVSPLPDLPSARQLCGNCPANTLPMRLAGCCGYISQEPEDPRLDAALQRAVAKHRLDAKLRESFIVTKPMWFGLWINSPLSPAQMEILRELLPSLRTDDAEEIEQFLRACDLSIRHNIPLHVELGAPGHTDFGYLTTFPHCPRCKKGNGETWEQKYTSKPAKCSACGHVYIPAETYKSEPFEIDDNDLEKWMEPGAYRELSEEWARRHANDEPSNVERMLKEFREFPAPAEHSLLRRVRSWFGQKR